MFKIKEHLTIGQQIVVQAHTGLSGYDEFTLTPDDCQYVLDHCDFTQPVKDPDDQKQNRGIKEMRKAAYVKSMRVEVIDTGDTLKFDTNGNLFDGRHRLTAAIELGIMFPTLVAFGRSTKAFAVTDGAIGSRTKAELYAMAGIKNGALLSSVTGLLMGWRGNSFVWGARPQTGEELLNYYQTNVDDDLMQDCFKICSRAYDVAKYPTTPLCAVLYILRVYGDEAKALDFMACITGGNWSGKNAAISVLFKLYNIEIVTPGMSMRPIRKLALLIHTWNNFHRGRKGTPEKLGAALHSASLDLSVRG
jgi:hypothetical protein